MPRTVGLAEFPPPSARWPSPPFEGGRKCVSWPFEAWATSDGRGMSSSADSRRGNDLFCRIAVDGVWREESGWAADVPRIPTVRDRRTHDV